MNVNDGSIHELMTDQDAGSLGSNFVEVSKDDMTDKQKQSKRVSLKDHKSKLGKQLTHERKLRKLGRNEKCHCGSGLKYKKCCLSIDKIEQSHK